MHVLQGGAPFDKQLRKLVVWVQIDNHSFGELQNPEHKTKSQDLLRTEQGIDSTGDTQLWRRGDILCALTVLTHTTSSHGGILHNNHFRGELQNPEHKTIDQELLRTEQSLESTLTFPV